VHKLRIVTRMWFVPIRKLAKTPLVGDLAGHLTIQTSEGHSFYMFATQNRKELSLYSAIYDEVKACLKV